MQGYRQIYQYRPLALIKDWQTLKQITLPQYHNYQHEGTHPEKIHWRLTLNCHYHYLELQSHEALTNPIPAWFWLRILAVHSETKSHFHWGAANPPGSHYTNHEMSLDHQKQHLLSRDFIWQALPSFQQWIYGTQETGDCRLSTTSCYLRLAHVPHDVRRWLGRDRKNFSTVATNVARRKITDARCIEDIFIAETSYASDTQSACR